MAPRTHSLWPREHGAYVQLLAPLGAALIAAPSLAGSLIAVAAFMAFVAIESLLVATGGRGKRAKTEMGDAARFRFAALALVAAVLGIAGLALAPVGAIAIAGGVLVPAILAGALAMKRQVQNLRGEIAASAGLSGISAVALVAGGASLDTGLAWWVAWAAGYATTVVAVQYVLAAHKRRTLPRIRPLGICAGTAIVLGGAGLVVGAALAAASAVVVAVRPAATQLRTVGITLAIISCAGGVLAAL